MKNLRTASNWRSPIGWLGVVCGREGLLEIFCHPEWEPLCRALQAYDPLIGEGEESAEAMTQIKDYFKGERRTFSLRLSFGRLSPFSTEILKSLSSVPFGQTVTYGELAAMSGRPGAARAVGRVMAVNPFLLVIPCHRVLGAGGRMTGYSGGSGVATKEWLLGFESDASGELRDAVVDDPVKFAQPFESA